jgi:hypothetical protein
VVLELTLDLGGDDLALWGAAEDLVRNHFECVYEDWIDIWESMVGFVLTVLNCGLGFI